MTRRQQLEAAVKAFHAAHPEVWRLFERFALEMAARRCPSAQGARASPAQDRSERGRAEARRILQRKRQAT